MAFVGSTNFSVEGDANNIVRGNQNVYNIQTAYFKVKNADKDVDDDDEFEFGEYRTIICRDIYKIQEIFWHETMGGNKELIYIAEVEGLRRSSSSLSRFTVVSHSGDQAQEAWKTEFLRFTRDLRSDRAQLFGLTKSKIPSLILYGDLVPLGHLTNSGFKIGLFTGIYLWALARNLNCMLPEIWLDPKTDSLCRGPRGPCFCAPGLGLDGVRLAHTSPSTEFLKDEICLRYFLSQGKMFDRMFLRTLADTTSIPGQGPTFPIMPTNKIGVFSDLDLPREAIAVRSGGGHYKCRPFVYLHLDLDWKEECSAWLAHAVRTFKHLCIPLDNQIHNYALNLPTLYLKGALASPSVKYPQQMNSPSLQIYLFVHPAPLSSPPDASTKSLHYWSFDKAGASSISCEECEELGLPTKLEVTPEWRRYFWPCGTYEVVCQYQEAKELAIRADKEAGGMEHAYVRHLGFDVDWEAVLPVVRFEEVEKVDKEVGSSGQEKSMWVAVGDIPAFGF
ncbi:hypothetical protein PQX77_021021 [Marasmius sp. AFHP31]|nr:hypothetical protein PQX77_021021 [Marasmius sp. AFHP31]